MGLRNIVLGVVLFASFGCTSFPQDPLWQAEIGWQAVHAADVLQTINGPARDDCFYEANPITQKLIGKHPSTGEVVAWGAGTSALHWGVTKVLDHYNAKPWVKVAWQATTITFAAGTVIHNHQEGIRLWGDNVSECNGSRF